MDQLIKKFCVFGLIFFLFILFPVSESHAKIVYVKGDATGLGNGSSWTHAFTSVQNGIDAANGGDEVWVAKGTYRPSSPLQMKNNVTITGGFGGWEYPEIPDLLFHRDFSKNATILDGSGNKSVFYHHPDNIDPPLDSTAVLDGFTIKNGKDSLGGGIYNKGNSPTFKNCIITGCSATSMGNGIYNENAAPMFFNCKIESNNNLVKYGGGIYNLNSHPYFESCLVKNNTARFGAGFFNKSSTLTMKNCLITKNNSTSTTYTDTSGAAMFNRSSEINLTNCTINSNESVFYAPGFRNESTATGTLLNCLLYDNTSSAYDDVSIYGKELTYQSTSVDSGTSGVDSGDEGTTIDQAGEFDYNGNPRIYNGRIDRGYTENSPDSDHDGLKDSLEDYLGTDKDKADTDDDGMDDKWEYQNSLDPKINDADEDLDNDGLTNKEEYDLSPKTCPYLADTDHDNMPDKWEHDNGLDPCTNDKDDDNDNDGHSNYKEYLGNSDPDDPASLPGSLIVYVNDDATGENTGLSWTDAFVRLQPAIDFVGPGDVIMVAAGTYSPTKAFLYVPQENSVKENSFIMKNKIKIYGGFSGNEPVDYDLSLREFTENKTILKANKSNYHVIVFDDPVIDETTVLDGFTISDGAAYYAEGTDDRTGRGGGIYNNGAAPLIKNCIFKNNRTNRNGGAVYNANNASPVFINCGFENNYSSSYAGAIYNTGSNPKFINCFFTDNSSGNNGGAFYNNNSTPEFRNCLFESNSSNKYGGAFYNINSSPVLINCNLIDNTAQTGAALFNETGSSPVIKNSIIRGNDNPISDLESFPVITFSNIQNGYPGEGNIDFDPLFTGSGDFPYMPGENSPCINSGDPDTKADEAGEYDYSGNNRFICRVDIGIHEVSSPDSDCDGLSDYMEDKNNNNIVDSGETDPNNPDTDGDNMDDLWETFYNLNPCIDDSGGDADNDGLTNLEEYQAGSDPWSIDSDNDNMGDRYEVQNGLDPAKDDRWEDKDGDGVNNYREYSGGSDPDDINDTPEPIVLYVKADASGNNTGLTWSDAFTGIQDAIEFAGSGDFVWVASGTYFPTRSLVSSDSDVLKREKSFYFKKGVSVYGGFEGNEDPLIFDPGDRDFLTNETILSGDFQKNDDGYISTCDDNAYHVIYNDSRYIDIDLTAVLDGFTISGGNAEPARKKYGGGLYNSNCSFTVKNCKFKNNFATYGGGMANTGNSEIEIDNCEFIDNFASHSGGGVYSSYNAKFSVKSCLFSNNRSRYRGGGVFLFSASSGEFISSEFRGNKNNIPDSENDGGAGICIKNSSSVEFELCSFTENSTRFNGGGAAIYSSTVSFKNCLISNNKACDGLICKGGGGLYISQSDFSFINSTMANNYAWTDGLHAHAIGAVLSEGRSVLFKNSIIWGDDNSDINMNISNGITCNSCNFEINGKYLTSFTDPEFTDYGNGDYSLKDNSPCKNTGDSNTTSAEVGLVDIAGHNRFRDTIDMGAFEVRYDYILNLLKDGAGYGTITSSPSGIDCGEVCSIDFKDSPITLTAVPEKSSYFKEWSDGSTEKDYTFNMVQGENTVTATFGLLPEIYINEIDSFTGDPDDSEFIELYDGGRGSTDLTGLVLVLYDGSTDQVYYSLDLDGYQTDSNGYFVIGNVDEAGLGFPLGTLQNGADAAALYIGDSTDFISGTDIITTRLVDAVVYDTGQADDSVLLTLLNSGQPQINELENGSGELYSLQRYPNGGGGFRNTGMFDANFSTPGMSNKGFPKVLSVKRNGTTPTKALQVSFIVTFSENVTGVDTGDFIITTGGGISGASAADVTGSGNEYIVSVYTGLGDGTIRLDVADNDTILNSDNNSLITGYNSGELYSIDKTAPAAPSSFSLDSGSDSGSSDSDKITGSTSLKITGKSENNSVIKLYSSIDGLIGTIQADSSGNWSVTANGLSAGNHSIHATAEDSLGNTSSVSSEIEVIIDTKRPLVEIEQGDDQKDPTSVSPIHFTAVFSEPVSGFTAEDIDFTGSTEAENLSAAVSQKEPNDNTTYDICVSGMTSKGDVVLSVKENAALDTAGNSSRVSTGSDNTVEFSFDIDYRVEADKASVSEGGSGRTPITFIISRSGAVESESAVDYLIEGTADFDNISTGSKSGTISFAENETSKNISLDLIGNFKEEDDKNIILTISNGTAPGTGSANYSAKSKTIIIKDDDKADFSVSITDNSTEVSESGTTDEFYVVLTSKPGADVVFDIVIKNPQKIIADKSKLTISPENWNKPHPVILSGVDDNSSGGTIKSLVTISVNKEESSDEFDSLEDKTIEVKAYDDDPEIIITGKNIEIPDGKKESSVSDGTYFGDIKIDKGPSKRSFKIVNSGSSALSLTGDPIVMISGENASEFKITKLPEQSVFQHTETEFEISFEPKETGIRTAEVSIISNDFDESLYTFTIQGIGGVKDVDGDQIPDDWEEANGLDPSSDDSKLDSDGDGLTNTQEYLAGTDIRSSDTDGDKMPDKWEKDNLLDPLFDDSSDDADNDTFTNLMEYNVNTDPQDLRSKPVAPKADAGPDQTVKSGETVMLNGLNSSGQNYAVADYLWTYVDGSGVSIDNNDKPRASFVAGVDSPAVTRIQLTVTDSRGISATDSIIINVKDEGKPPVAIAGAVETVSAGSNVTLDGSGSYDEDGEILNFEWIQLGGEPVSIQYIDQEKAEFGTKGLLEQSLKFSLIVTDNDGFKAGDEVIVNITNPLDSENKVPKADAGDDFTADEGVTITLSASGSTDQGLGILEYEWTQLSGPSVTLSDIFAKEPVFVVPAVAKDGEFLSFRLIVKNDLGLSSSDIVTIKINNSYSDTIKSGVQISGINGDILNVFSDAGSALTEIYSIDPSTIEDGENKPESLPFGLLQFKLKTLPGETIHFNINFPKPLPENTGWFKYDSDNGWKDFSANAEISESREKVILTLTDGGEGDADGLVNGEIVDPSGPGLINGKSGNNDDKSTSSASGCFMGVLVDFFRVPKSLR